MRGPRTDLTAACLKLHYALPGHQPMVRLEDRVRRAPLPLVLAGRRAFRVFAQRVLDAVDAGELRVGLLAVPGPGLLHRSTPMPCTYRAFRPLSRSRGSPQVVIWWEAGDLGFEPRLTDSESVVLPLHQSPKSSGDSDFSRILSQGQDRPVRVTTGSYRGSTLGLERRVEIE